MNSISEIVLNGAVKNVTRLETIDHTGCTTCNGEGQVYLLNLAHECPTCHGQGMVGRTVEFLDGNKQIKLSLQDDGRTLKIFIEKREN